MRILAPFLVFALTGFVACASEETGFQDSPAAPAVEPSRPADAGRAESPADASRPDGRAGKTDGGAVSEAGLDDSPTERGRAIQVATSGGHACALLDSGRVKCWGYNGHGQLGNGLTTDSAVPVDVGGISTAIAIAVGTQHTCALLGDGSARCWGDNYYRQLGNNSTAAGSSVPVTVAGSSGTGVSIAAGNITTCITLASGGIECWGDNGNGEIGDGTTTTRSSAVAVTGIASGATSIDSGGSHTCAVINGAVQCWGLNFFGGLGDGTTTTRPSPVSVLGLPGTVQTTSNPRWRTITTGGWHSCSILTPGQVQCWGHDNVGQLGDGTQSNTPSPVVVSGISDAVALSASWYHTCALRQNGEVRCWGNNGHGELGAGAPSFSTTPVIVAGLGSPVTDVAAGGSEFAINSLGYSTGQTCAVAGGAVWCWGDNTFGQLGRGTTAPGPTPAKVSGF